MAIDGYVYCWLLYGYCWYEALFRVYGEPVQFPQLHHGFTHFYIQIHENTPDAFNHVPDLF